MQADEKADDKLWLADKESRALFGQTKVAKVGILLLFHCSMWAYWVCAWSWFWAIVLGLVLFCLVGLVLYVPVNSYGHVWTVSSPKRVAISILARSHTLGEIDHEIIFTAILLPSPDLRRIVVSYKWKYVHKVLVNHLVKLAQEKSVVRWTDHPNMTIAVDWDVKNRTKNQNIWVIFDVPLPRKASE